MHMWLVTFRMEPNIYPLKQLCDLEHSVQSKSLTLLVHLYWGSKGSKTSKDFTFQESVTLFEKVSFI